MLFDNPRILAEERRNQLISALVTLGVVLILAVISFVWTGIRMNLPPPGEEDYEVIGSFDFGDYKMGSKDVNTLEEAVEDPNPDPVEEVAAPVKQPDVTETREDPTPVITQDKPTPVTTPDVKPTPSEKPKKQETVVDTKPKVDPKQNDTGTAQNDNKVDDAKPNTNTNPSGSNQGDGGDVGNAGIPDEKVFDDRYAFQWGASSGGGGGARRILYAPYPEYTAQEEGALTFTITIRPNGTVASVVAAPTLKRNLKAAALRAIRSWKFGKIPSNQPQENQVVQMTITFKLKG